jgi:predicted transcriptional regulator
METVMRRGASNITRISYGANLPVDRAKKIVLFLCSRGLLKDESFGDSTLYRMTGKGGQFLNALRTVRRYVQPDEEDAL